MPIRLQISILVYLMVQAVMFGVGVILVLATPVKDYAMTAMPLVVIVTAIVSAPLSWLIAPRLRSRYSREHASKPKFINGEASM